MILKKFLNFWKSEPRDSYKKKSYKKECMAKKYFFANVPKNVYSLSASSDRDNK